MPETPPYLACLLDESSWDFEAALAAAPAPGPHCDDPIHQNEEPASGLDVEKWVIRTDCRRNPCMWPREHQHAIWDALADEARLLAAPGEGGR